MDPPGLEKAHHLVNDEFQTSEIQGLGVEEETVDKFCFFLDGTAIPCITEKPVKSLGKVFHCCLRDAVAIEATIKRCET